VLYTDLLYPQADIYNYIVFFTSVLGRTLPRTLVYKIDFSLHVLD